MYRELLSAGMYDSASEYAQLNAFAKAEYEEEVAREEYKEEVAREEYERNEYAQEYFSQQSKES